MALRQRRRAGIGGGAVNLSKIIGALKPSPSAPSFACATCEDTGLIFTRATKEVPGYSVECRECDTIIRAHVEQFGSASGIPSKNLSSPGCSTFAPRPDSSDDTLRAFCERYIAEFTPASGGAVFYGPPGTGKSYAAACIASGVLHRRFKPRFWDVPDLMAEIKSTFSERGGDESEWSIISDARDADLLVLDDIGSEKASEFVNQELFLIINGRLIAGRPTIVTTNVGLNRWDSAFGPRIASRLYEVAPKGSIIAVGGKDRRKDRST